MKFDLDIAIIVLFLIANLAIGLFYGRGKTTLREYAVGNKNFSTGTIAATVIATCIGGGFFSAAITETYKQGLYFIIPAIGEPLCIMMVGYFFVPRMAEFLGTLSIADALGNLYGKTVRIISATAGIFLCIGIVALQFKVGATILKVFFNFSSFYAVLVCAIIVTVYSAFGGISAVTFTDIIQFFTFGTIVPIISLAIWGTLDDPYAVFNTLAQSSLFDYSQVFHFSNSRFLETIFLLSFFLLPEFQPVFFQRIIMSKDTFQARKAFLIGGAACLVTLLIIIWVGVLLLSENPSLDPNNLLAYIISKYNYVGLKGLTVVGIMAIIMSTADSYINSAAVLFTNDIMKPLDKKIIKLPNDITLVCICSFVIGIIGFWLAFKASTILNLLLLVFSFYSPIVSIPLILAILGFRSSTKSVLIGMAGGFITVVIFNMLDIGIDSVIPGVIANATFLIGSHYALKQPGGWVGVKNKEHLNMLRSTRRRAFKSIKESIINFNLMACCKRNTPRQEYIYALFGLFCLISVFSTMYSLPKEVQHQHRQIIEFIYNTVLLSSSIFLTYPVWPSLFKREKFIIIAWNIAVPYALIFSPLLLVILSNFGEFQLMILMLNLLIISMLLRWQFAIFIIFVSVISSIEFYKWFANIDKIDLNIGTLQFKIMYLLLLVSSVLIAFLRPQQRYQEQIEQKTDYLEDKVKDQRIELSRLQEVKNEFLRNLEHEAHTPITGITSMGQVLWENYDKFSEEQRRLGLKDIAQSAERLTSLVNNLIDISKLETINYRLNKSLVNLSDLVRTRLEKCRQLFIAEKNMDNLSFDLEIEDGIIVSCDEYYISRTIDNIIINAIQYCKEGKITIILKQIGNDQIEFSVKDEGIGIPKEELFDIFEPFTLGSRTKTPAGGRGIGLALCKKVIEAHGGQISAESNIVQSAKGLKEEKGTIFNLVLPKK